MTVSVDLRPTFDGAAIDHEGPTARAGGLLPQVVEALRDAMATSSTRVRVIVRVHGLEESVAAELERLLGEDLEPMVSRGWRRISFYRVDEAARVRVTLGVALDPKGGSGS